MIAIIYFAISLIVTISLGLDQGTPAPALLRIIFFSWSWQRGRGSCWGGFFPGDQRKALQIYPPSLRKPLLIAMGVLKNLEFLRGYCWMSNVQIAPKNGGTNIEVSRIAIASRLFIGGRSVGEVGSSWLNRSFITTHLPDLRPTLRSNSGLTTVCAPKKADNIHCNLRAVNTGEKLLGVSPYISPTGEGEGSTLSIALTCNQLGALVWLRWRYLLAI